MNSEGIESTSFRLGEDVIFEIELDPGEEQYKSGVVGIGLYNQYGQTVCAMKSSIQTSDIWQVNRAGKVRCTLHDLRLVPREYTIALAFSNHKTTIDYVKPVSSIEVIVTDVYGTGQTARQNSGYIVPYVSWEADAQFTPELNESE